MDAQIEYYRRELSDYKHSLDHLPAPCDPPPVDGRRKEKIADFTIRGRMVFSLLLHLHRVTDSMTTWSL